jgi:RNA polymerase sigma-70 factor (ECF subfamily)
MGEVQANDGALPGAGVTLSEPSDRSLLRRFRGGSQDAATQLYLRYVKRVRALARSRYSTDLAGRVDVDDIVQSVFRHFFHGARQGYYDVPDGDALWKLFLVMAINKIRTLVAYHRAAKRDIRQTCSNPPLEDALDDRLHHDNAPAFFFQLAVEEALQRLPAHHRRMVELRVEGYEVAEIAQQLGRSKRTVERILQEARKRLADLLAS